MELNQSIINSLIHCNWLENCGKANNVSYGFTTYLEQDKEKVIASINAIEWGNLILEESGNLTEFLCIHHRDKYSLWNTIVKQIKTGYMSAIQEEVITQLNNKQLPAEILLDIQFNIIAILMADFYKEFYKSTIFEPLLEIYLSGHLPCGWKGVYPEGGFLVY